MLSDPTDQAQFAHERLGDRFEEALSIYDTARRVEVLVDHFLPDEVLEGLEALDVGCGLGYFSERLARRGANVTAVDIGPSLVEKTRNRVGCRAQVADALALTETFGAERFDVVVSSECIEHTPDPQEAVRQMAGVLKPGGYLSLSTPNLLWYPLVRVATLLKLRPFDGHENFSTWGGLRGVLQQEGMQILREVGLHLFPFQLPLHHVSRWCDAHLQVLRSCMINICFLARKDLTPSIRRFGRRPGGRGAHGGTAPEARARNEQG